MTARPDFDDRGVYRRYLDADDDEVLIDPEAVQALRELVGTPPAGHEDTAPLVLRRGERHPLGRGHVVLEDGSGRSVEDALPADLPSGYHRWQPAHGAERDLILSPGRCHLPTGRRDWGLAVQLYAARSRASWGIGDLADLGTVRDWARGLGARFLMVNPLHAVAPTLPQEASPYSPTSRRFASPLYLRPELVPGAARVALARPARPEHGSRIDRDAIWPVKRAALRAIFDARTGTDGFEHWRAGRGPSLQEFATWCALAERHGSSWRQWPLDLRHPSSPAVREFARAAAEEVSFHAWLQWALAEQLSDAADGITVIQDLPIGFSPDGADAWAWQDLLAPGVTVGAPPDKLNHLGQDWGLPPFVPWRLRASGYAPFIESIRATIAGAGGLRIDHVMGLFRLWWVLPGGGGGYVRYPRTDLLDIVALESERASALVVGEDLGTVEDGVREDLTARRVLAYRVLWFEDDAPSTWPELSMAAVSTHDLPTVAGLWSGSDRAEQQEYGVDSGAEAMADMRGRLGPVPVGADDDAAITAAYTRLAGAASLLRTVTLEDAVGERVRPNLPGVVTRPNWSRPLPVLLEDLPAEPGPARLAALMSDGDGSGPVRPPPG